MPSFGRRRFSRLLALALIAAAVVVVILLVLILGGVLVLTSNGPAPVTIDGVHLQIHEGNGTAGPWFGPDSIYYGTAEGYPLQVAPGGTWTVNWFFVSVDPHFHNVTGVLPQGGFTRGTTQPPLPYEVGPNDDGALTIPLIAPSTAGATYALVTVVVVIDATS